MRIRNENTYMNHSDKMCYIRTTDDDDIVTIDKDREHCVVHSDLFSFITGKSRCYYPKTITCGKSNTTYSYYKYNIPVTKQNKHKHTYEDNNWPCKGNTCSTEWTAIHGNPNDRNNFGATWTYGPSGISCKKIDFYLKYRQVNQNKVEIKCVERK